MKLLTLSDTHGRHNDLTLPPADVLIHAGDISIRGNEDEVISFLEWFDKQNFKHKILIAGNHDFFFEREPEEEIKRIIPASVTYLNDSYTIIDGIKIWGSPITPWFFNWAFNRHRGDPISRHWEMIPADTDIIVTHGPVHGILDRTRSGQHAGCEELRKKLMEIKPKAHICGHIHENYGLVKKSGISFINASLLNEKYQLVNQPVELELSR